MQGAIYSLPVKFTAIFLSVLTCALCTVSVFLTAIFISLGFYNPQMTQFDYYQSDDCSTRVYYAASTIVYDYYSLYRNQADWTESALMSADAELSAAAVEGIASIDDELAGYQEQYSPDHTNFRFTLLKDNQTIPISTYAGEEYGLRQEYTFTVYDNEQQTEETLTIQCYVVSPFAVSDEYSSSSYWYTWAFDMKYQMLALAIGSTLLLIVLCVYLICAAGRKKGVNHVVAGGLHTVPFDLLTVMVWTVGILLAVSMGIGYYDATNIITEGLRTCLLITGLFALGLFYVMSFAVRCKQHTLWKNTIIYRVYHWIKNGILRFYRNRSIVGKSLFFVVLLAFLTFFVGTMCISSHNEGAFFLYVVLVAFVVGSLLMGFQVRYRRIRRGIEKIAHGDLETRISTKGLYDGLKEQAENLNQISAAVQTAVEKQLKSERMKTELITNVSHDIKTPLTSIVNYVDLLKKQQIQDPTAKEYIEVLERQAIRLKKLIEDLIEASKASTGNISVNLGMLDTTELLKQVSGEYIDRLAQHQLELVLTVPEKELPVLADGQLLWRVFDNLLSNAMKYSQPGTRVYLDLTEEKNQVLIVFRNISRYPLNISGEELMERFVRGDSSRHTEGSGLGLSIARSLTELMNGRFEIKVDGDLFKAQVTLTKTI